MARPDERTPLLDGEQLVDARADVDDADSHAYPLRIVICTCCSLWFVTFICSLDTTIVAMLLGKISSSFHASEKSAWIGSTYLLSVCTTAPLYGRLCDSIGCKRSLSIALVLFTIGTFLCGSAASMTQFLAARTIAGIGGGGLTTIGSVVMTHMTPLHSRGVYQGLTNIVYGLGVGIGGPLGGILNDRIGWRGAFYIQLPILLGAFLALVFLLPHDEPADQGHRTVLERLRDVDLVGVFVFAFIPLSALYMLDLVSVRDAAFSDWRVVLSGLVSLFALVAFYMVERHAAKMPLISLDVLAVRTGWSSLWSNFWMSVATFAFNYNFPLFFQTVGELPASVVGVRMVAASIALSVGSLLSGFYMRRTGRFYWYNLVCMAMVVVACGRAVFYTVHPPLVSPFVYNAVQWFGQAGMLTCTLVALINSVERKAVGVSTGMSYLFRSTGQVYGVAVSGAILQRMLTHQLRYRIVGPESEELIARIRHESTAIPLLSPVFREAALESYAAALQGVFVFVLVCNLIAFGCSACIEDKPLRVVAPTKPRDDERV